MNKAFAIILAIAGCAGGIASIVMVVMAARFMELGRVVFYLMLAFICAGIAIMGITNLMPKKE